MWREKEVMDQLFPPVYQLIEQKICQPIGLFIKKGEEIRCPYLDGNQCRIYDKRPLTCKVYPLTLRMDNTILFDSECPGVNTEIGTPFFRPNGRPGKMVRLLLRYGEEVLPDILQYEDQIITTMTTHRRPIQFVGGDLEAFIIEEEHYKPSVMTFEKMMEQEGL
jgi:hypothetical protein